MTMHAWVVLVLFLVFFALCFQSVRAETTAGTPILLTAEATWDGGSSRAERWIVVESPLPLTRPVCAPGAVRQWQDAAGEWHTWVDPTIAGCRVMFQPPGSMYPVEGTATNDGRVCVDGTLQPL